MSILYFISGMEINGSLLQILVSCLEYKSLLSLGSRYCIVRKSLLSSKAGRPPSGNMCSLNIKQSYFTVFNDFIKILMYSLPYNKMCMVLSLSV